MITPERSPALGRALASEADGLPHDFAQKVAALADAGSDARRAGWNDIWPVGAFAAMIGICVAGWLGFEEQPTGGGEWLGGIVAALAPHPWLLTGMAGVAIVHVLTFRRRATT
jgi:hypothetical protein